MRATRRRWLGAAVAGVAGGGLASLAGCAATTASTAPTVPAASGTPSSLGSTSGSASLASSDPLKPVAAQERRSAVRRALGEPLALHVLQRLSWGPRPGEVRAWASRSLEDWIEPQLNPQSVAESPVLTERLQAFESIQRSHAPVLAEFAALQADALSARRSPEERQKASQAVTALVQRVQGEARRARILRAVHSERQLQEVLVAFWFNHFNVFAGKESVRVTAGYFEAEAIRPHVLGRFRDLLGATARHPAMLNYLDNWQSVAQGFRFPPAAQAAAAAQGGFVLPRGPNENYARELLELHTLGVQAGYSQEDVASVARVFTGWSFDRRNPGLTDAFRFYPARHDASAKAVLGQAVQGQGQRQGEWVLDLLARHPATARRVSLKLARHFVGESPPQALVNDLAQVFLRTDGDLKAVMRALVYSDAFVDPQAYGARYKAPDRFVISAVRACGLPSPDPVPMALAMGRMGMPMLLCPTPDGWADTRAAWLTPEGLRLRSEFAQSLAAIVLRNPSLQVLAQPVPASSAAAQPTWVLPAMDGLSPATREALQAQPEQHRLALALASPDFSRY